MKINLDTIDAAPVGRIFYKPSKQPYILPLPILGFGSGNIEALSSYICRQAENVCEPAHPYSMRMLRSILEDAESDRDIPSTSHKDYYSCNGIGALQSRFTNAIQTATKGQIKAQLMTLKPLEFLTDRLSHGLIRDRMHWCQSCWNEDLARGDAPYLRLYWTLKQTHVCAVHNRKLLDLCPACGNEQQQFPSFPRQHICDNCGHELYKITNKQERLAESYTSEESWFSHANYNLIEKLSSGRYHVSQETVSRAFRRILNTTQLDINEFSEKLKLSKRMVKGVIAKTRRLYFPSLLDMCYRLDIPPDQFLFEPANLTDPSAWRTHAQTEYVIMAKLSPRKKQRIYEDLAKELKSKKAPPVRLSHVASKHGIKASTIRYNFPKESKELARRYRDWERKFRKESNHALLEALTSGIFSLARTGVYPSERKLRDLNYVKAHDLRREDVRLLLSTYQDIYKSHGFLDD